MGNNNNKTYEINEKERIKYKGFDFLPNNHIIK